MRLKYVRFFRSSESQISTGTLSAMLRKRSSLSRMASAATSSSVTSRPITPRPTGKPSVVRTGKRFNRQRRPGSFASGPASSGRFRIGLPVASTCLKSDCNSWGNSGINSPDRLPMRLSVERRFSSANTRLTRTKRSSVSKKAMPTGALSKKPSSCAVRLSRSTSRCRTADSTTAAAPPPLPVLPSALTPGSAPGGPSSAVPLSSPARHSRRRRRRTVPPPSDR